MLHKLRRMGSRCGVRDCPGSAAPGSGTAIRRALRCAEPGICYTFDDSIDVNWKWTERYATQPEILRYLNHIADRLELRGTFSSTAGGGGGVGRFAQPLDGADRCAAAVSAPYLIMASGALSAGRLPDIPGLGSL